MITRNIHKLQDTFPLLTVRVIDGDTLQAEIGLPFGIRHQARIRLKGWWAPEPRGPLAAYGNLATERLQNFCEGKALWILCPSQRQDKYGRLIATLMHQGRIISAREVLGDLQMTEAAHKAASDALRASRQAPPAETEPAAGVSSDGPSGADAGGPI